MQLMPMYRVRQRSAGLKHMQITSTANPTEMTPMKMPSSSKLPNSAQKPTALIRHPRTIRQNRAQGTHSAVSGGKVSHNSVRDPEIVNQSMLNMLLPTIQQMIVKAPKRSKSKGKSGNKSTSIGRSSSKENAYGGLRMRKIFINGKLTPSNMSKHDSFLDSDTHNLLVDRKDMKVHLAPLKKKNGRKMRERSTSIKSPCIMKSINLNQSAVAGR